MTKVDLAQDHQNEKNIADANVIAIRPVPQAQVQVVSGIAIEGGVDTGQRVFPDLLGIGTGVEFEFEIQ